MMMTNHRFDKCIQRILGGDRDGLKQIYEAYETMVFACMQGLLLQRENAEDLTVEFFIKLWDQAGQYKPGRGHKSWMMTMARNMAIDFLRKNKREIPANDITDLMDATMTMNGQNASKSGANPEVEVLEAMSVTDTLKLLSASEEQIVNMKILGDLTFKEIAEVMGMPMGTVTWKYQNAINKLRRKYHGA